ncbi:MAG: 2-oxo acid dehydrogenase subunit E2 [Ideonella sp.]|nr:2-oxo acid dehydrogenase subunit E2 [Ideonella sp.]MCC7455425.1 2-oxo acid dehydrogenase subunit E2 [Nitrospira sp.]
MSERTIKMPDIGEGIAEVELVAWHVKPGDTVAEDQPLADVMTDKASVEIPSPVTGTVTWVGGAVGTVFAVGAEIVKIEVAGSAASARGAPAAAKTAGASAATTSVAKAQAAVAAPAPAAAVAAAAAPATRAAVAAAAPRAAVAAPSLAAKPPAERPIASPSVRRRAWELGVDLARVRASGTAGRVMHADLDAYAKANPGVARDAAAQPSAAIAPTLPMTPSGTPREGVESIAVIGLRRKIALRMQDAKRRIPHFSYVEECDVTELEALRAALNAHHGAARGKLTLLPFLMRAIAAAVAEHPAVNALFDDEKGVLARHAPVHVGIATQTGSGLMVPVVRHAEALSLWQAAAEVARLAAAARAGSITRGELSGSTITITSLGAIGGIVTTPIINAPEVAIVGVNRIVERPVVRGGQVVVRQTMNLSSSFDHRVVDGHVAALFVQALKRLLETPALLFVD